jgi:hypothetical protein
MPCLFSLFLLGKPFLFALIFLCCVLLGDLWTIALLIMSVIRVERMTTRKARNGSLKRRKTAGMPAMVRENAAKASNSAIFASNIASVARLA